MYNDIVCSIDVKSLTGYYSPELFLLMYCPTRTTILLVNAVALKGA